MEVIAIIILVEEEGEEDTLEPVIKEREKSPGKEK